MEYKGLKHSEKFELKKLVQYQEGSVVSKEMYKKEAGTVTLFAFARGQGLSPHSAPFEAIVQIIEGTGIITIAEEKFTLTEGAGIIMPANVPHAVQARDNFKMLLVMIKSPDNQ